MQGYVSWTMRIYVKLLNLYFLWFKGCGDSWNPILIFILYYKAERIIKKCLLLKTSSMFKTRTSNYWLHKVFEEIWQGFRLNNTLFKQFPSRVFESKAFCMTNLENNFHNEIAYWCKEVQNLFHGIIIPPTRLCIRPLVIYTLENTIHVYNKRAANLSF